MPSARFAEVDAAELKRLQDKNINKNTKQSTNTWVNRFEAWRVARKLPWKLEDIPLAKFDDTLQHFFAELKTRKGEDYEPDSLRTMLGALNRHLRDSGCAHRISDEEFVGAKRVLNGKAIDLREKGKGKKKRKADPITEQEEEQTWATKVLGDNTPISLNYTVWYLLSQQFGTRGCQEHHQLCVKDLKFVNDPNGKPYYAEWVEGPTKTRRGGFKRMKDASSKGCLPQIMTGVHLDFSIYSSLNDHMTYKAVILYISIP